jgi:signal transduction histidine kinase
VCDRHTRVIPAETFTRLAEHDRLREISILQQRAEALEREIERRAELEGALRAALADVHVLSRLKEEFLGVLSHELRTPLHAILGWSAILRARPSGDVARAAATIERNARSQLRMIEDALDVSRILSGKLQLAVRPVDLARVLRDAIEVCAPAADGKGVALQANIESVPCAYVGDPERLQQVFWHLLSNAIKFTAAGGRVDVGLVRLPTSVEVAVSDTGCGIHDDFLPFVFVPFRQADSSTTRAAGGLGLGLAMVRHLVEMHGGHVTATSEGEGKGATFRIVLPTGHGGDGRSGEGPPVR